ncbi:NAD(P)-dependent oxidoreductase [Streptomyces microflavus]|uniref:NAD(P)-dependent oxidoreductase n=1 Tax=Streptomyces microflavus TaxID=1919 RepID=UPI002E3240D4|nr:DUF1932 domain-containing protein [Streptomyces microflavus]
MITTDVTVGILHPGSMGAAVAGQLRRTGVRVLWVPDRRSPATVTRAETAELEASTSLGSLLELSDVVIALCPPAASEELAHEVAGHGLAGKIYVEANAISPARVRRIAEMLPESVFVDAAVIGSPPVGGKRPRLYVSGSSLALDQLNRLFAATDVRIHLLGEDVGKASALKLSYTSYQKASRVLAAVAYGAAEANGVADDLLDIASQRSGSYLTEPDYIPKTAARAWRWGPEMEEAAELLADAGLPDDLMRATASVLARWNGTRDTNLSTPEALEQLRHNNPDLQPGLTPPQ